MPTETTVQGHHLERRFLLLARLALPQLATTARPAAPLRHASRRLGVSAPAKRSSSLKRDLRLGCETLSDS
jgi:hypothetical protein